VGVPRRALKKLADLEDGTEASKTKKKKLYIKVAALRKQLGIKEPEKVDRSKGWTEDRKKEMRMAAIWTRWLSLWLAVAAAYWVCAC
jgi:hypothetical protein